MSREVTHQQNDDGHMVQIVTAQRLREILDQDGDTHDKPKDFGPQDEWKVAE